MAVCILCFFLVVPWASLCSVTVAFPCQTHSFDRILTLVKISRSARLIGPKLCCVKTPWQSLQGRLLLRLLIHTDKP